jgi:hypothetical protein
LTTSDGSKFACIFHPFGQTEHNGITGLIAQGGKYTTGLHDYTRPYCDAYQHCPWLILLMSLNFMMEQAPVFYLPLKVMSLVSYKHWKGLLPESHQPTQRKNLVRKWKE